METPKLSVSIITYNRPNELIRAVNSCFPLDIDYELLIWDNHSTPENSAVVREFCTHSPFNIRYFYSDKNLGVGGGRDALWRLCRGEYIFTLDDDAVIASPNFFQELISYMDARPLVAVAYPCIYEPSTGKTYECEYQHKNPQGDIETFIYQGGAHLLRRDAVLRENLYPTGSVFGGEEMYASLLFWNDGYAIHQVKDLLVHHLPTAANRHLGKERDKLFIIASYSVKKLLFPVILQPAIFLLFLLHLAKNTFWYDRECRRIVKAVYRKEEAIRIHYRCLTTLARKFGFKPLI